MIDERFGYGADTKTALCRAMAELHILAVHEKSFIKKTDRFQKRAAHKQAAAGQIKNAARDTLPALSIPVQAL